MPDDPIADLSEEDFRGRTEFRKLTAAQKLLWLAHAGTFALEARASRAARDEGAREPPEDEFTR